MINKLLNVSDLCWNKSLLFRMVQRYCWPDFEFVI
jgi:hypothetical protein